MNNFVKMAAVKKYSTAEGSEDEIKAQIAADEKGYTPEEVDEIYAALPKVEPSGEELSKSYEEPKAPDAGEENKDPEDNEPDEESDPYAPQHFEEWRVEIKGGSYEKLKRIRPRVMITEDQAAVLNHGVVEGGNTYALMYFKPGEDA